MTSAISSVYLRSSGDLYEGKSRESFVAGVDYLAPMTFVAVLGCGAYMIYC